MIDPQTFDIALKSDTETDTQLTPDLNTCSVDSNPRPTKEALRLAAQITDNERAEPFEVSILWHELCRGTWRFVSTFSSHARCYAILRESRGQPPPDPRLTAMLALTMSGQSRKVLAFDMNLSVSTVSGSVQACLRSMGLECRHAPVLLIMAACHARLGRSSAPLCRVSRLEFDADQYIVVSARQPDLNLPSRLSDAEASVIHELLGGLSYAAIAEKRATSVRTVANQIAAAFRKLGVSGRQAMIEWLLTNTRPRDCRDTPLLPPAARPRRDARCA